MLIMDLSLYFQQLFFMKVYVYKWYKITLCFSCIFSQFSQNCRSHYENLKCIYSILFVLNSRHLLHLHKPRLAAQKTQPNCELHSVFSMHKHALNIMHTCILCSITYIQQIFARQFVLWCINKKIYCWDMHIDITSLHFSIAGLEELLFYKI